MKEIHFVDETLCYPLQSVWATRLPTESMLGIILVLDEAKFKQACVTSAMAFESALMYLYKDNWERLRPQSRWCKNPCLC